MSSHEVSLLAHGLLAAQRIFEEKTASAVREWVELRVLHLDLWPSDASRPFRFVELTDSDKGLIFESEDWEETWQYGGHETHSGRSIIIPFDFFDDPEPYREKAYKLKQDRKDREALAKEQSRKAEILRLERELAKAREEG